MDMPNNAFVVVADGAKALFFRNEGDHIHPCLAGDLKREQPDLADRDIKTDAPGRGHASTGAARSAMDQPDYHQQSETASPPRRPTLLRERALASDFEALIVVAPPPTLGELRKYYHNAVKMRLIGEIGKNLTGHPVDEIERIILAQD